MRVKVRKRRNVERAINNPINRPIIPNRSTKTNMPLNSEREMEIVTFFIGALSKFPPFEL